MPERVRSIVARLREFISDRRQGKRQRVRLPLTISLVRRPGVNGARPQSIDGHTFDVSNAGLSFILSAIRIGDHYLAGESQRLEIRLELPVGPVEMQAVSVRYERLEDELEIGYLVGVTIKQMSEPDRVRYQEYLGELRGD